MCVRKGEWLVGQLIVGVISSVMVLRLTRVTSVESENHYSLMDSLTYSHHF